MTKKILLIDNFDSFTFNLVDYFKQLKCEVEVYRNDVDPKIIDEIKPEPGDLVIRKARYSGFAGTSLESELRGLDIRHLFFTGVATNVCVDSTARDAYFAEFWPILIEDAMNHTGPDFTRDATLWFFETKAGWITDTQKVMDLLERAQA